MKISFHNHPWVRTCFCNTRVFCEENDPEQIIWSEPVLSPCPGGARCWEEVQKVGNLLVPMRGTALSQVKARSVTYSQIVIQV